MGYKYDDNNKLSFDAQRAYEYSLKRTAASQRTANERSRQLRRWYILTAALLMTLILLGLLELRISGTATAAQMDATSKPQVIRAAQPASRTTTTAAEIMQPSAFESATHSTGVFPVVPHRFPDAEQGTEGGTTTTGTLFIVQ